MFTPQQRGRWTGSAGRTVESQPGWLEDGDSEELAWKRFREAGLLDEADLQRKEREGFLQRISELETELSSYQHNMGLLLIEKNELAVRIDDLGLKLEEANEIMKREQSARIISVSESERREEALKNALAVEKQCVADLSKALSEVETEINLTKSKSDEKLKEARMLESRLEDKKEETERKLRAADARLAEATVKNSQAERKLEDAQGFEKKVKKDRMMFDTEREILEKNLAEKERSLRDWEAKLNETQRKFYERQDSLNEREDRVNQKEQVFMQKQQDLEETRKETQGVSKSIKAKEADLDRRLQELANKEKEFERKFASQEIKERGYAARDENLSRRELEVEKKMHKLKEMDSSLDSKSRALKNWEASVKSDEKKLKSERQQFEKDLKELENSRIELNILKNSLEKEKLRISRDEESLKLTNKEREEHLICKSQLEREIEKQREINESILKQTEDLRKQKEDFEREWELLDEKRRALNEERESFLSLRYQDEGMKNGIEDERTARYNAKLEEIKTKEEILEIEIRKKNLEMDEFYKKREKELLEFEKEIQERKASEEKQIESKSVQLKREKETIESEKQKLEKERDEFGNDITTLSILRSQIKNEREELIRERDRVFSLIEKLKSCKECGANAINEADIYVKDPRNIEFPKLLLERSLKGSSPESDEGSSGARSSWLKKCSGIFKNISPVKKAEMASTETTVRKENNDNDEGKNIEESERENNTNNDDERNNDNNMANTETESTIAKTKGKGTGRGKRAIIQRTHSVAEVMKESKKILGEGSELNNNTEDNTTNLRTPGRGRKRRDSLAILDEEQERSKGISEQSQQSQSVVSVSVGGGGRKKRRQTLGPVTPAGLQTPGEKRYNLRRSTRAAAQATASRGATEITKPTKSEMKSTAGDGDEVSNADLHNQEVQQIVNQQIPNLTVVLGTEAHRVVERSEVRVTSAEIVEEEIVAEPSTPVSNGGEEEYEEDEDENKTIGKKIWNFLIS